MTVVTYAHRIGQITASATDYDQSASAVVEQFSRLDWIEAVVICGSYAKGSLAPGWSDLDVVAVYRGNLGQDRIRALRLTGAERANPKVPVGLDVVNAEALQSTRRIVGRPLAMSFELQKYAMCLVGSDPFGNLAEEAGDAQLIRTESELLVRADANSFLRRTINGYLSPVDRLFDAVKTLLRIAMFESSALPCDGVTIADYCSAVRKHTANERINAALEAAEALRMDWPAARKEPQRHECSIEVIQSALMFYCESWQPTWDRF